MNKITRIKESMMVRKSLKKYIKDKCEKACFEITGLIGYREDAVETNEVLCSLSYVDCFAYSKDGEVIETSSKLLFPLDSKIYDKYRDMKDLYAYELIVRKIKDENNYLVVKIKGEGETNKFEKIIEKNKKPEVVIEETIIVDGDTFTYDKVFKEYTGTVVLENRSIKVDIVLERGIKYLDKSLETLKMIKDDFDNIYNKVLSKCAKDMIKLANSWREDGDTHEITEEEFCNRIDKIYSICINEDGYIFSLSDGNIFAGHCITYMGNINDENHFYTNIEG